MQVVQIVLDKKLLHAADQAAKRPICSLIAVSSIRTH
jgi:hypothetical protein